MKPKNSSFESLTNEDAYKLISAIGRGTLYKYNGHEVGEKFRQSVDVFKATERVSEWISPPQRLRLEIDDVIDSLLSRNSPPMIHRMHSNSSPSLSLWGPYTLVRDHLAHFAIWQSNPAYIEKRTFELQTMLRDVSDAKASMGKLLRIDPIAFETVPTHTFNKFKDKGVYHMVYSESVESALENFNRTLRDLEKLAGIIEIELEVLSYGRQITGRPRETWKAEFVSFLANLWHLLTQEDASGSPDSWFGKFVGAAWRSYDEHMPEVSFDRAIRERKAT